MNVRKKISKVSPLKLAMISSVASLSLAAGIIPLATAYAKSSINPMYAGKMTFTNISAAPGATYDLGYYSSSNGIFSDGYTNANIPFYITYVGQVTSGQWSNPAGTQNANTNQHQTGQSGGSIDFWINGESNTTTLNIPSLTFFWN